MEHTPVLIAGGGLTGLTASLLLTHHGVRHVLVERHEGTAIQPKARRFNFRTMEVFRGIGLESTVHEAAKDLADYQTMRRGGSLLESEAMASWSPQDVEALLACSPCDSALIAQDVLEPVLRAEAERRGGDLRFATELTSFTESATGVEVHLSTRTGESTLRADHMIAADGSRSPIREALGITRSGRGTLGRYVNVHFRADLTEIVAGREFNLCMTDTGTLASIDGTHRWLYLDAYADRSAAQLTERIRRTIGAEVDIEILSVLEWDATMRVADSYGTARILLAGDAAHVMPPFAAMGANTGVLDVHNLAWKLAHVLGGSDASLLASYDEERRPAGAFVAEQSVRFGESFGRPDAEPPTVHPLALVVGLQYASGALTPDGSPPAATDRLDLAGQPGTRIPHAWLDESTSTLDLVDRTHVTLSRANTSAEFAAQAGIGESGHVVVRPDGIVASRSR